jgi:HlyD family secretion protein
MQSPNQPHKPTHSEATHPAPEALGTAPDPSPSAVAVQPEKPRSPIASPTPIPAAKKPVIWPRFLPIGLLLGAFAVWAFVGKIPMRASGRAVILVPRSSVAIQPRTGGRVVALNIRPGDRIKKGQLLATMESPEQTQELQNKRDRLADLEAQDRQIGSVQGNRSQLNQSATTQKQEANLRQIESLRVQLAANQSQRAAYIDHLNYLNNFREETDKRLDTYDYLVDEGIVPPINMQSYFFLANQQTVNHAINEVNVELERLNGLDDSLRAQIRAFEAGNEALNTENTSVELTDTISDVTRYNLIADQKREIAALEALIKSNNEVISPVDGTVEEIIVNAGEVVLPGGSIGKLAVDNPNAEANVIALFHVGDAKRLVPGTEAEVIPDLYPRERYGGMIAKVVEVGEKPVTEAELANLVGSRELAFKLSLGRDERDPEKPQAVNVSTIKVELELEPNPDTPSGYQWTEEAGPPQKVTDGTTSDVHVVLEERSLIDYLNPAFRWITGVYGE